MNRMLLVSLGVGALALAGAARASADVIVMEDGRRIRGELVSVNRGTVLFDEIREGSSSKRRVRLNKDEVARIILREGRGDSSDGPWSDDDGGGYGRRGGRMGRPGDDRTADNRTADDDGPFGEGRARDDGGLGRDRDRGDDRAADDDYGRDNDMARDRGADRGGILDRPSANARVVTVSGRQAWTDTGIDLRAGDVVRFSAQGLVQWGAGRQDGPGGEYNSPVNDRRPVPGRPAGALIGRIGTSAADVFFIGGDQASFRVKTSGRLYLGVNDDYFGDNSGSFEVRIAR